VGGAPPITPIDLSVFAEIIDNARTDNNTGVVATIGRDGPDVALKGSLLVWDRDHVAWWERTLRETYAAIQNDPRVCVLVRNPARDRRTVRLYGTATIIDDLDLRERIWERVLQVEKETDKAKKGAAVLVRVDRVRAGLDTVQQRA